MKQNNMNRMSAMGPHFILHTLLAVACIVALCDADDFCPRLYHKGVLELEINPAFLNVDAYNVPEEGDRRSDGLTISSFFNVKYTEVRPGVIVPVPFAPDQVGRIMNIGDVEPGLFDYDTDYEKLTGDPQTTWPNDAHRIPDGMLPFEGVVIPQG